MAIPYDGSPLVDSMFAGEGKVAITYSTDPMTGEGAGGWLGSAVDLTRVMTAFEGTRVANFISAESRSQMLAAPHLPSPPFVDDGTSRSRWRGYGLESVGPTTDTYSHGGLMQTSQAALHHLASGYTFAIVTNMRANQYADLYIEITGAVLSALATQPAGSATDLYSQYPSMSLPARNP